MKMNFRNRLISNLITVIITFCLLIFFDHSGTPLRNIIIVFTGFILMTVYDFVKTRRKK